MTQNHLKTILEPQKYLTVSIIYNHSKNHLDPTSTTLEPSRTTTEFIS